MGGNKVYVKETRYFPESEIAGCVRSELERFVELYPKAVVLSHTVTATRFHGCVGSLSAHKLLITIFYTEER